VKILGVVVYSQKVTQHFLELVGVMEVHHLDLPFELVGYVSVKEFTYL
jgi:hypothetical protein